MNQPTVSLKDYAKHGLRAVRDAGYGPPGIAEVQRHADLARGLPVPKGQPKSKRRGTMNKLETRYSELLEDRKRAGVVAWWGFEAIKFRLADNTWYTPDFLVMLPDGTLELHETKGFMRSRDAVRTKVTAEAYWMFPVYVVRWEKKAWSVFPLRSGS